MSCFTVFMFLMSMANITIWWFGGHPVFLFFAGGHASLFVIPGLWADIDRRKNS